MKRLLAIFSAVILLTCVSGIACAQESFVVYMDKNSPDNHYAGSGWMGDHNDIKLNDESTSEPYSGSTCIEVSYNAERSGNYGWAGIYWQNPPNNWGSRQGGYDLTGMNKLTFWARGKSGGEIIEKIKVGGIKGTYPDSTEVEFGPIELSDTWEKYTVNLSGEDLSYISGGFVFIVSADLSPDGTVFYFDEIKYEKDENLKPELKLPRQCHFMCIQTGCLYLIIIQPAAGWGITETYQSINLLTRIVMAARLASNNLFR